MNMCKWIYHGKNKKQCWYQPNCVVCYIKTALMIIKFRCSREERERESDALEGHAGE